MRIIVCVKQVKFTYARTGFDPDKNYIAPGDNIFRINPWDESALDIALKLKEKDGDIEVIVLTLGPVIAEKELKRCIAVGADEIYRIDTESDHDSWSKSVLLARGIKKLNADLVFCGKESVDKQNGQAGAFIAHHLGLPFVSDVINVETGIKQLETGFKPVSTVMRKAGKGVREEIECPLPAVFSISLTGSETRLPVYEQKQKALASPFKILEINMDKVERKIKHVSSYPPRPRPKKVVTPDSSLTAFERINQLLAGSNIEKKGKILIGDSKSQVEGIISYLIECGFLEADNPVKGK
ncbi:electron transfer flavoprotein subunit beta/FixA family protein [Thermodesulfobacteriota bacterium]